jgi:hypothetical protein
MIPKSGNRFSAKIMLHEESQSRPRRRRVRARKGACRNLGLGPPSRALVHAPRKAARGAPRLPEVGPRTSLNRAFGEFRRLVVEREVTTKRAVGHREDDCAYPIRLTHLSGGVQHRIEHGTSADKQRRRKKHQKQRQDDGHARGFRLLLIAPDPRGAAHDRAPADVIRRCIPQSRSRARSFACAHASIKPGNSAAADNKSGLI